MLTINSEYTQIAKNYISTKTRDRKSEEAQYKMKSTELEAVGDINIWWRIILCREYVWRWNQTSWKQIFIVPVQLRLITGLFSVGTNQIRNEMAMTIYFIYYCMWPVNIRKRGSRVCVCVVSPELCVSSEMVEDIGEVTLLDQYVRDGERDGKWGGEVGKTGKAGGGEVGWEKEEEEEEGEKQDQEIEGGKARVVVWWSKYESNTKEIPEVQPLLHGLWCTSHERVIKTTVIKEGLLFVTVRHKKDNT